MSKDYISDIVGAIADPIIVFPGGWGDSLPEWLKNAITLERLLANMESLHGKEITGTDAEAAAYLMTLSLSRPISQQWSHIYLYVAGKTMKRFNKELELPADIKVETLSEYDARKLNDLKAWIYKKRTDVRKDRERDRQRQEKKEAKQQELYVAAENKQESFF